MTNFSGPVWPGSRRAERFTLLLDDPATASEGTDLALLETVGALRSLPEVDAPRPEFTRDLRERLLAEADEALVPVDESLVLAPSVGRASRRVTAVAAALVLSGTSAGMAVAAQGSVLGDPLYGVKRGLETIGTSVSLSPTSRGHDYLDQSGTRLRELQDLVGDDARTSPGDEVAARRTLESFSTSARQGSALLLAAYQRDASADDVAAVRTFAATSMSTLREQAAVAPEQLQDAYSQAASTLTDIDQQARELCAACGEQEPLDLPVSLMSASAGNALDQLIDDSATAQPTVQPSVAPATTRERSTRSRETGQSTGQATGQATGARVDRLGSVVRSQVEQSAGGASSGTGSASTSGGSTSGDGVSATVRQVPRLVKLPGSQSGAPSVIDLDDLVGQVSRPLDGTLSRLGTPSTD